MYKEYEAQGFPQSDQENTSESFPLIDVHLLKSYKQKRRLGRSGRNQSLSAATDLKNLDKKNNEFANLNHSSGLHNDISGMKVDQDDSQPTALSSPIGFLRAKSKSPSPSNSVSNRETSSSCKENRNPHHADLKFHQSAPFFLSSQCNNRHQSAGNSSGTSQKPSFMFSNPHDMNRTYLVEKNFIHSTANKEEPVEPLNLSQHHDSANKSVDQLQIDSAPKLSMPELLNKNIHPNKSLSPEFQIHCNRTENQDLPNRILQPNCMPAPLNNNQNLFQRNSVFQKEPPPAHKELCPVQKDPSLIQKEPLPAHKELYPVQRDPSIIQKNSPPAHKELYPVQKDPSLIRKEPPPAHKELCPVQKDPSLIQKEQLPVPKTAPPVQKDASLIQKEPLPAHKELYPVQENPYSVQKEPLPVPKKASPVQKDPCPEYPFKVPALVNHKNQPAPSLNITRTITANQPQIQQRTPLVPVVSQRPTQASPITDNKDNIIYVNSKPYISLSLLGKGGTSKVFLVQDPSSNKLKAIKCVDLSRVDQMFANAYLNEIELLIKLQECDTVIKMFDHEYLENERMLYVVLEKGDTDFTRLIKNLSKEKNEKDPFMIFYYWGQILKAVKDIHDRGIIHSDLKPDNFLLVQGKLKLIDFGIASSLSGDMTSVLLEVTFGTLNYISPEAIPNGHASKHGYKISCKSDVWSLGCILYNLVYGKTPFSHLSRDWIKMQAIVDSTHTIDFPEQSVGWKIPLFLLESMKQCLNRDPKQRPTVGDLINRLKSVCSSISSDKS